MKLYCKERFTPVRPEFNDVFFVDVGPGRLYLDYNANRIHRRGNELNYLDVGHDHANWRIVFRFEGQDAYDVELIDYH